MKIDENQKQQFIETVKGFYTNNKRSFPWRETTDPYEILVSEFMLQQTQTDRVVPKYTLFTQTYPTIDTLARASFKDIARVWQGLGYNRRSVFLLRCAKEICTHYHGIVPSDPKTLVTLPGIGPYTAAAIAVFAFNQPVVLIETNIRSVFIYHFFDHQEIVSDKEILSLIEETLDVRNPRPWYWALMDYGVFIKKSIGNPNVKSKHYTIQSPFSGSNRQKRGAIITILTSSRDDVSLTHLSAKTSIPELELHELLVKLEQEGLVTQDSDRISLAS